MLHRYLPYLGVACAVLILLAGLNMFVPEQHPKVHPALPGFFETVVPLIADDQSTADVQRFEDIVAVAFDRILEDYVDDLDVSTLLSGAAAGIEALDPVIGGETGESLAKASITGMLAALDPYSRFFSEQEAGATLQSGLAGIGIKLGLEGGDLKVFTPFDGTPAFRAGILPGDVISRIDGADAKGLTMIEAVMRLRGAEGRPVTITIRRAGLAPFDVTLVREVIRIPSVRSRLLGDVGYVRVAMFSERAARSMTQAIDSLLEDSESPPSGIVLDLRRNPGGPVEAAVAIADNFLEGGEIARTRGRRADMDRDYAANAGDLLAGLPLAVLIDNGTTGTAELVAGALQDQDRGVLLGARSAGRGHAMEYYPIVSGGAILLTVARYETPSGRSFDGAGIAPDIAIGDERPATVEGYGAIDTNKCLADHGSDDAVLNCAVALVISGDIGSFFSRMRQ